MKALVGLIFPVILLLSAYLIKNKKEKSNSEILFYKTKNARKTKKSLKVANEYAIRLLIGFSWISIFISLIIAFALRQETIITQILISIGTVVFSVIFTIVSTEKYLKIVFKDN